MCVCYPSMEYSESDTLTYNSTVRHTNLYGTFGVPPLGIISICLCYFFISVRSGDADRPGCGHRVRSASVRLSGWHGSLVGMEAVPCPQTTLSRLVTTCISQ